MAGLLLGFLMGIAPIWSLRRFPPGHWVVPGWARLQLGESKLGYSDASRSSEELRSADQPPGAWMGVTL